MPLDPPLSKQQLRKEMKRFLTDPYRGISKRLFAEICGISLSMLDKVFVTEKEPLSEDVQIRVNRGYAQWKAGQVRVMKRPNQTLYVDYRREPKPVFMPYTGLQVTKQGIKLVLGPRNRHDYSATPLDEQLGGKK